MTRSVSDTSLVVRSAGAARNLLLRLVRASKQVLRPHRSRDFSVSEGLKIPDIFKLNWCHSSKGHRPESEMLVSMYTGFWEFSFDDEIAVAQREYEGQTEKATSASMGRRRKESCGGGSGSRSTRATFSSTKSARLAKQLGCVSFERYR